MSALLEWRPAPPSETATTCDGCGGTYAIAEVTLATLPGGRVAAACSPRCEERCEEHFAARFAAAPAVHS